MRNNNALVDTNVLVYAIDEDSQFYERSHQFLFNPNYRLYNSAKNLVEFLTVVTRNPAISLSTEDALSSVKDYEGVLKILYPSKQLLPNLRNYWKNTNQPVLKFMIMKSQASV